MSTHVHRAQGLRQWEEWLEGRLSPWVVRGSGKTVEEGEAIWRIDLPDEEVRWVHVSERALTALDRRFDEIVRRVEKTSWLRMLVAVDRGIRIHANGRVKALLEAAEP